MGSADKQPGLNDAGDAVEGSFQLTGPLDPR
jgi:hypothetical protein